MVDKQNKTLSGSFHTHTPVLSGNIPTFQGANGAVLYTAQNLTEAQKAQARANIGAAAIGESSGSGGNVDGAVLYTEQTLTDEQKAQARANIGAATVKEVIAALPVYNGEVESA